MAQGDNVFYYIKQAELVPDKYGKHIKTRMISAYTGNGKFVKHMKLDKELLQELKDSVILPAKPKQIKDVE
mgnify:FL=1